MTSAELRKERARLRRIIKGWRERLYMEHIELAIEWDEEPEDENALASISPSDLYDHATMRFASGWWEHDSKMLNRIVVHELLHVLFRDYMQAARSICVTGEIPSSARAIWFDRCHDAEEGLVDRLAVRFVQIGGVIE